MPHTRALTLSSTIKQDRQTWIYRLLESSLSIASIGSIALFLLFSWFLPAFVAMFVIIYSLIWLFKFFLNVIYTIHTYQNYLRWKALDWYKLIDNASDVQHTRQALITLKTLHAKRLDWSVRLQNDIDYFESIKDTKYSRFDNVYHVAVFATYNEGSEVLLKSLKHLYESQWYLDKLIVIVSQEARLGSVANRAVREEIKSAEYIKTVFLDELNQEDKTQINLNDKQLNVFFTEHPDGLVGEIKGKASNEDWGARQSLSLINCLNIDEDMVLVTSLDADSHIGKYFFHNLSLRFCLTPDRHQAGFQPIHLYSNNFFQTGLFPRQVATQTTLYNLTNLSIDGEIYFFAIYSVPLKVLKEVDFWVRDVIAEDYLLFIKCLTHFDGNFRIVPHFGFFEGDAVEAEDYIEEIINQYKQLQRWAWGGVEGFPYMFKRMILTEESRRIPLGVKLKWLYLKFSNHFFWVTTPLVFSIGAAVPVIIHGESFQASSIAQNLSTFSQYFAWISFIFMFSFGYLTFRFIAKSASKKNNLSLQEIILVSVQLVVSPLIYGMMSIPALDAQIRGLLGKYMGYWVTPKK